MRRFTRLRGALASTVFVALAASNAEAVAGDMRDGTEHHESVVVALEHRAVQGIEHQHEREAGPQSGSQDDSWDPSQGFPGEDHRHPGGADHCSHLHGVAIPPSSSVAFYSTVTEVSSAEEGRAASFSPAAQPHPPRA